MDEEQRWSLYQNPLRHLLSHQIFKILQNGPAHGYQIMLDVERNTKGCWRPSTAMVYRVLAEMEAKGYLKSTEEDVGDKTRRVYHITRLGQSAASRKEKMFTDFINVLVRPMLEKGNGPPEMLYVLLSPPGRATLEEMPAGQRRAAARRLAERLRLDLEWLEGLLADAGNSENTG